MTANKKREIENTSKHAQELKKGIQIKFLNSDTLLTVNAVFHTLVKLNVPLNTRLKSIKIT